MSNSSDSAKDLLGDAMLQRLALKQLHGDKRTPFEFSDVVNGANARMIQRGCGARFAPEPFDRLRVLGNVFGKKFQRNVPAEPRVFGFIDDAHASAADFFEDGIMGDGATDNRGSVRHSPWSLPQRLNAGKHAIVHWATQPTPDPNRSSRHRPSAENPQKWDSSFNSLEPACWAALN